MFIVSDRDRLLIGGHLEVPTSCAPAVLGCCAWRRSVPRSTLSGRIRSRECSGVGCTWPCQPEHPKTHAPCTVATSQHASYTLCFCPLSTSRLAQNLYASAHASITQCCCVCKHMPLLHGGAANGTFCSTCCNQSRTRIPAGTVGRRRRPYNGAAATHAKKECHAVKDILRLQAGSSPQ